MPAPKTTTPPDLDAMYNQVLGTLGGPVEVETPQLGRTAFPRPAELYQALNYIRMAQAQAAGVQTAGVITIGYDRGLGDPIRSFS